MKKDKEVKIIDYGEDGLLMGKCLCCGKSIAIPRPKSSRDGDEFTKVPNYCKECE